VTKKSTRLRVVADSSARPHRVLGYARVSSEAQAEGVSLADQERAIRTYAASLGVDVARVYVEAESGGRAAIERREQMRALLDDVRPGDLVVVHRLDRWSRDIAFSYTSVEKIVAAGGDFQLLTERCGPRDPNWDTIFGVHALVARLEHRRIRERMVGTRQDLRDRGYYVEGLPPLGYRRSLPKGEKGPEKNALVIVDGDAARVRAAFAMCASGHSLAEIAEELELGDKSHARDILRSRVYLGQIRDTAGSWITAKHPAIVDAMIFQRAQDALDARRLGGARPRNGVFETSGWMLRDVATCALCGGRMGASYAGPLDARRYYYRCVKRCTSRFVRVDAIEAEAAALVVARLEELREELAREPVRSKTDAIVGLAERRTRLQRRRERYVEAVGEGLLTRDDLRAQLAKLQAEQLRLDALEAEHARPAPLGDPATRRAALGRVGAIRTAWALASGAMRREIVGHLATACRLVQGEPPVFVWRTAEQLAERA
jgi:site-specific DNA recombinase